jgi:hypothetical protein
MGIVKSIHNLAKLESPRKVCRYIYSEFDKLIQSESYHDIDQIILRLNVEELPNSVIVALLTVTSWCGDNLSNRHILYDRAQRKIDSERPGYAEEVLHGLN